MFKDFFDGVGSYGKAWNIISTHKLWYYVLMPGLISLILGGSIAYSAYLIHDDFSFFLQELKLMATETIANAKRNCLIFIKVDFKS